MYVMHSSPQLVQVRKLRHRNLSTLLETTHAVRWQNRTQLLKVWFQNLCSVTGILYAPP